MNAIAHVMVTGHGDKEHKMDTIKLSDLEAGKITARHAYLVVVDTESKKVPTNLNEVSFLLNEENFIEPGEVSDNFFDTLLHYKTCGVERVVVDIPFEVLERFNDLEYLVNTFMLSLTIDICALPPKTTDEKHINRYTTKLTELTKLWLHAEAMGAYLYPTSNYYIYMIGKVLGHTPEAITNCDYLKAAFGNQFTPQDMDKIKIHIEKVILDYMGGEDGLVEYVNSAGVALKQSIEEKAKRHQQLLDDHKKNLAEKG